MDGAPEPERTLAGCGPTRRGSADEITADYSDMIDTDSGAEIVKPRRVFLH